MDKVDVLYSLGWWINVHCLNQTVNLSLFQYIFQFLLVNAQSLFFFFSALNVYTILHRKNTILSLDAVKALEERLVEDDRIFINKFE